MKNISIVVVVYNEEDRIEKFCESFSWSDDLIIINKASTDQTKNKALKYTSKIIDVPYSDIGSELKYGIDIAKNEWIMTVTASDTITKKLVKNILELINSKNFNYDMILMPYKVYILGISEKYSPWNLKFTNKLSKKECIVLGNKVHEEYKTIGKKIYTISPEEDMYFYHLTHENLEILFERHHRYAKAEIEKYIKLKNPLKIIKKEILKEILKVIKKRTIFKGDNGIGLGFIYISYFMFKYLYLWEKQNLNGKEKYDKIYSKIIK